MRFTLSTLALLLTALSPVTEACLYVQGILTDNNQLTMILVDNGVLRCQWNGGYPRGQQMYISCEPGFYSWINLSNNGAPNGVEAYAYNGLNFRFPIAASRRNDGWTLGTYQYCSAAQVSSMKALVAQGGGTVPEMLAAASKVGLLNEAETAEGAVEVKKGARSFNA